MANQHFQVSKVSCWFFSAGANAVSLTADTTLTVDAPRVNLVV